MGWECGLSLYILCSLSHSERISMVGRDLILLKFLVLSLLVCEGFWPSCCFEHALFFNDIGALLLRFLSLDSSKEVYCT